VAQCEQFQALVLAGRSIPHDAMAAGGPLARGKACAGGAGGVGAWGQGWEQRPRALRVTKTTLNLSASGKSVHLAGEGR